MLCESGRQINNICYDTKMKSGKEFQSCNSNSDCKMTVIGLKDTEIDGECITNLKEEKYCIPSSQSTQWKNYVKAVQEISKNRYNTNIHQSLYTKELTKYKESIFRNRTT